MVNVLIMLLIGGAIMIFNSMLKISVKKKNLVKLDAIHIDIGILVGDGINGVKFYINVLDVKNKKLDLI
jgi:hypothetical protein